MKKLLLVITVIYAFTLAAAKKDSTHTYIFQDPDWVLIQRIIYSYPDANTTQQSLWQFDQSAGSWIDGGGQKYSVDEYGNMVSFTTMFFGMEITQTITNTYDDGKLVEAIWQAMGVNATRELYTWQGELNTEIISQIWENNEWVNSTRTIQSYEGNHPTGILTEEWVNGAWQNWMRITNTYEENKLDHWTGEQWFGDHWAFIGKYYLLYDDQVRIKEQHNYDWDGNDWILTSKQINYYGDGTTDIDKIEVLPENFSLSNYPNPFNPTTNICFEIPKQDLVTLQIFDMTGKLVKTILQNDQRAAGYHELKWNATDNNNLHVPTGIYVYSIKAGKLTITNRCLYIK